MTDWIKTKVERWLPDLFAGMTWSGIATLAKYMWDHFLDIGWTCAAAVAVMIVNHYGRKYLIPWLDSSVPLFFNRIKKIIKR